MLKSLGRHGVRVALGLKALLQISFAETTGYVRLTPVERRKSLMNYELLKIPELAPIISENADQAERERRLARPVVDALIDAGIFKLLASPALGGAGATPIQFREVVAAISAIDGSTGWRS
jgi:alkylation response protein AidB-like acyl-CoA dehydrogenase